VKKEIKILGKTIGDGYPTFLIAEIGSNHNRDKEVVFQLIDATAKAGFDAVKFQIYDAEEAFSKNEMTTDVGLEYLYGVRPWWEIARDKILMPR
jgi:sialic acid synthase SpsE